MADVVERLWKLAEYNGTGANAPIRDGLREAVAEIETLRARLSQAGAGGGVDALREAAEEFCRRVEAGEVRSKRSYAAFKAALAALAPSPSAITQADLDAAFQAGVEQAMRTTPPAPAPVPTASVEAVEDRAKAAWNAISDGPNQWHCLSLDERDTYVEFAAALASLTPAPTQGDGGHWPKDPETGLNDLSLGTLLRKTREEATPSAPVSAPSPAGDLADLFKRLREPRMDGSHFLRLEAADVIYRLSTQFAEAREAIVEANNSLFGSQGYFLSSDGGPADRYHLSRAIEDLKANVRTIPSPAGGVREALEPFARLEIPKKPVGNAGAYSIRHDDIRRARAALSGETK